MRENYKIVEEKDYDYYINVKDYPINYNKIKYQEENEPYKGTMGKYLLFNINREDLIQEAYIIADEFDLSIFRVSKISTNNNMYSFVCGIYDYKDRFSDNIGQFVMTNYLQSFYRKWKTQFATDSKWYSNKYLKSITKNQLKDEQS